MSKSETQAIANAEIDLVDMVKKANSGDKQSLAILRRELVGENVNALIDIAGRAERRHLRAVKMLETIRKMALPLRIDIKAEVNVSEQKTSVGSASRFDLLDLVN